MIWLCSLLNLFVSDIVILIYTYYNQTESKVEKFHATKHNHPYMEKNTIIYKQLKTTGQFSTTTNISKYLQTYWSLQNWKTWQKARRKEKYILPRNWAKRQHDAKTDHNSFSAKHLGYMANIKCYIWCKTSMISYMAVMRRKHKNNRIKESYKQQRKYRILYKRSQRSPGLNLLWQVWL